jgi:hypothetical protein
MKKKILAVFVIIVAFAMVLTPMMGIVQAGKGQEELEFWLHIEGTPVSAEAEKDWGAGNNRHLRNYPWVVTEDFYIEIRVGGDVETIPKEELEYVASLDTQTHLATETRDQFICNAVIEIITIYTDDTKTAEWGTLEIRGHNNPTGKAQSFVEFGTGEFDGVKIKGTSNFYLANPPPDLLVVIDRVGTVMGWPTP